MDPIIILGSGLGGYSLAREFRKLDPATPLMIVTRDDGCVYSKPMLSNALASGKTPIELATAVADKASQDLKVTVLANSEVTAIDPEAKEIRLADGTYRYQSLILALGAEPVRLQLGGDAAQAVHSVNDLDDYKRFHGELKPGSEIAIIGGGLIGCEFANDLAAAGFTVTVIAPGEYPMQALLPKQAGIELQRALSSLGVSWMLRRTAVAVHHDGEQLRLELDNGHTLTAHVVLSAVGLRPRTTLAAAAGVAINRGIVVDQFLRTSQPDIYALGDCMEIEGKVMPYVMPIMHSARALAKTLAGQITPVEFPHMPVAVKTPCYPIIVQPAPKEVQAHWITMESDNGLQLWQIDENGKLHGFALTGAKTRQRMAMLAKLEQA